jgi:HSP90 family molecular chaperone
MKTYYHSESANWSSKGHGKRNVVTIKNGKGTKTVMSLNKAGKPVNKKTVKLSRKEIKNILEKKFMPGFWSNCNAVDRL